MDKLSQKIYLSPYKIGKKIKEARKKLGSEHVDVAKNAEISMHNYARIERDEEIPTLETRERLLKALNLKYFDILRVYL